MQLTKPQSEIFCSNSRFRVCVAGRRFGKTFLSTGELLKAAIGGKNRNTNLNFYKHFFQLIISFLFYLKDLKNMKVDNNLHRLPQNKINTLDSFMFNLV